MRNVVLLDLDGVLLDVRLWEPEWKRLSVEAFSPLLGGENLDWAAHTPELWRDVWFSGTKTYTEDRGLSQLNLAGGTGARGVDQAVVHSHGSRCT